MWPDRVSNPGPLALESDALPTALRGAAKMKISDMLLIYYQCNATDSLLKGRFLEFRMYHNFANLFSKFSESTLYKEIRFSKKY